MLGYKLAVQHIHHCTLVVQLIDTDDFVEFVFSEQVESVEYGSTECPLWPLVERVYSHEEKDKVEESQVGGYELGGLQSPVGK